MLILALESSARAASAALCRDGALIAQSWQQSGLTHSRTLLPMVRDLIRNTETKLETVDLLAVAHGPGSFTGIRIGVSTVKGLCWGAEKPAVGVSTLEAIAWNGLFAPPGAILCPVMDARRGELYSALFLWEDSVPRRLCPDRAIAADELAFELAGRGQRIYVVGDGAELCMKALRAQKIEANLAPEPFRAQSAWGVAMAAQGLAPGPVSGLLPVYLRLSQAERERQAVMRGERKAQQKVPRRGLEHVRGAEAASPDRQK